MTGCLVLAAGASSRMGGFPKALAEIAPGRTALSQVLSTALGAGLDVVVVTGFRSEEVAREAHRGGARVVENIRWEEGRTGSVQAGLREGGFPEGWVVVWPVDHPLVKRETLLALQEALREPGRAQWIIPTYANRGGHPVALGPHARAEVLGLGPGDPLNSYPRRNPARVRRLEVPDPGVLKNLDTWTDFNRIPRAPGSVP
jgi:molybdenum cofactor cytidylyltransferase